MGVSFAAGHGRGIVLPKMDSKLQFLVPSSLNGSNTALIVILSVTPVSLSQVTWTPIPCQSASKILCGLRRAPRPVWSLQGRSLRKGVRFSVQIRSEAREACRSVWVVFGGMEPEGRNARVGRVVYRVGREAMEVQKSPARALLSPTQRVSTLRKE